jgi:tetratricopeptide (TPR) repeat protein
MTRSTSRNRAGRLAAALAVAGAVLIAPPALAVSSGGSSGGTSNTTCREGWVWNKNKGICERAQSGLFDDRLLYEQGRDLALAGEYGKALALFDVIADKQDADVLTMIGYSKRKMGKIDEGIAYYHRALAIDPDNVNTREYLGEGYVAMGRLDLAQGELDRIAAICGESCEQYLDLAAAMAGEENWN